MYIFKAFNERENLINNIMKRRINLPFVRIKKKVYKLFTRVVWINLDIVSYLLKVKIFNGTYKTKISKCVFHHFEKFKVF